MNFYNSQLRPHPSADDSNVALCQVIAHHIAESPQRRISFAEYMDMVLYHTEHGYYSNKALNLGKQGDFFTAVHLGADFGELLAVQFVQMWEILGRPVRFSLVEMGAGQGILALDMLKCLQQQHPDFFTALDYVIVEKSPTLRQEQQQRLQEFPVRWCNLEEIPSHSITGCFFSNELVDAMPVHQFILEQGQLREIYVTTRGGVGEWGSGGVGEWGSGGNFFSLSLPLSSPPPLSPSPSSPFVEITGEASTPQIAKYFDLVGIEFAQNTYADGYRSEINLAALHWLSIVADRLQRGYVLTIDYGYPASGYYNPRRSQGTLQCYYQHQRHNNPYTNIGQQDITAHVDFTALERWGEHCGLDKVGFTQQGLFLMALGLGDRIAALSHTKQPLSELLSLRDALHQLVDPLGLGGFGVLVQRKGLSEAEISLSLKGFSLPE